jgi:clan AA aspartic protease (TIGR02281 family)
MPVLETILFLTTCGLGLNAAKRLGDDDGGPAGGYAPPPQPNWNAYQASPQPYAAPYQYAPPGQPDGVRIGKDQRGQYIAQVVVPRADGREVTINMMVDTGASYIFLTHADAKAIGLKWSGLAFNRPVTTVSGREWAAVFILPEMHINDMSGQWALTLTEVKTCILKRDCSNESLIGLSAIDEVSATFERGTLVLRA